MEENAKQAREGNPVVVGRIVHRRLRTDAREGECRPAMIVKVWNPQSGLVNLTVFPDGGNDGEGLTKHETSVGHFMKGPGTYVWHWPHECHASLEPENI